MIDTLCDWCEKPGAKERQHCDPWGRINQWFVCQHCERLLRELEKYP